MPGLVIDLNTLLGLGREATALTSDQSADEDVARRNRLSKHDSLEDLRLHGNVRDIADVSIAVFERNGQISVVSRNT